MLIYYSGGNAWSSATCTPEILLGKKANVMLSFASHTKEDGGLLGRARDFYGLPEGSYNSHFLDSGAFALQKRAFKWARREGLGWREFYDTMDFWTYIDTYAEFVKRHQIELYANVDAIPDPDITLRSQRYLEEKHGLRPVPVVHFGTDLDRLRRYIAEGYELIGLGGLVVREGKEDRNAWIDRCFELVADTQTRKPTVKLHGFGVTSYPLLIRYPWWSVDSSSWSKHSAFGAIPVPHKRRGVFTFDVIPYLVDMSSDSKAPDHFLGMSPAEKSIVEEWLDEIGVPLGVGKGEEIKEYGVSNRHYERNLACLLFFERLRDWLPAWPWPFQATRRGVGFDLTC